MAIKILLVEDNYFIYQLYLRVLKNAGYNIILAEDGDKGIKLADKSINLILLDVMLPKADGITVLRKLKQNSDTRNIPVVLLTNLGQESIIKSAFELGAQGYLMKMRVTPYEIADKIKPFLDNPSFQMDIKELNLD